MGNFTKPSTLRDSHEILKVTNLSKSYKNKKVLREINLNVSYGESVALIGSNGSGKSTLILQTLFHALNLTLNKQLFDQDHAKSTVHLYRYIENLHYYFLNLLV